MSKEFKDTLGEALQYVLDLEYLGVHVEDSGTNPNNEGTWYKITVPETSELVVDEDSVKELIGDMPYKTSDELTNIATYVLREKMAKISFTEEDMWLIGDDDEWSDFVKKYFRILVKVREGDTWNNEKAVKAVKDLISQIKEATEGYSEV